jgi:hypothetical protein
MSWLMEQVLKLAIPWRQGLLVPPVGKTGPPGSPSMLLEYEVIWGHIDILIVAVRRLSGRKTLLAGPSPTSPMKRRLLFPTYVGSVKINVGHLEAAGGLAGVIKAALAIEKGIIPSNMNFEKENEKLTLEKWNLKVILLCDKYVKIANMQ